MAVEKAIFDIIQKIEKFQREGSFWIFIKMQAYLNISFFKPLKGKSYVELPKKILLKKATVNVQNKDTTDAFSMLPYLLSTQCQTCGSAIEI